MRVNLYDALQSRKVAINTLIHDLVNVYKKNDAESISCFLELFVRCLGSRDDLSIERVNQSIDDGKFVNCIHDILRLIVDFDNEMFIFNDNNTLTQINNFIREFCSVKNPMIRDEQWMQMISQCLLTLTKFSTEFTNSVGIYFSLKFAHDLEMLRVVINKNTLPDAHATGISPEEIHLKKLIGMFLENVALDLTISRSCFDLMPGLMCAIIRSSNTIYILENCQLNQLLAMVLVKHKGNKEILSLIDDILKNGKSDVKLRVVEILANCTELLFSLIHVDNVNTQIAALKVILAAQRILGKASFLLPNQNLIVYNMMSSTNNNMREVAKKFFLLTYSNPNTMKDEEAQTMVKALMKLFTTYEDTLQHLDTIIKLLWRHFPPIVEFIDEVCRTQDAAAFKILLFYLKKIMEPDVEDVLRRQIIDTYLRRFDYTSAACGQKQMIYVIVTDTLYSIDLKTYVTREHDTIMRNVTDFVMGGLVEIEFIPTLYHVNVLLRDICKFCDYAKGKIKGMLRDLIQKFTTRNDETTSVQLSAALYIHNIVEIFPQKKWLKLLETTKNFLDDIHVHTSSNVQHILAIHAELLSAKWMIENVNVPEQVEDVMGFINQHIMPFMTFKYHDDRVFNLQVMQAFSLVITSFVKSCPINGYEVWDRMQTTLYKYAQQVLFSSDPLFDASTDAEIYPLNKLTINAIVVILECVPDLEHPINITFAKFIFLMAKAVIYGDMLHRLLTIIFKYEIQAVKLFGAVCHSFTFYPDEKILRAFLQMVDEVIATEEENETKRNLYRQKIVTNYIESVGRYIRHVNESKVYEEAAVGQDSNRLCVLRYIKDLLKECTANELTEVIKCQSDFINPDYLNAREKDSLKDFVKSIS